nr:TolC family protein [Bacteroidota bacterium]
MSNKIIPLFLVSVFFAVIAYGQDTIHLNLDQSLQMAQNNNRLIKIFQYRIENEKGKLTEMKSNFYPRLKLEGNFAYNSDPNIHVYKGEFNHIYDDLIDVGWIDEILDEYLPLPPKDMILVHGDNYFYKANIGLYQPISQLTTINTGKKISETDLRISEIEKKNVISEVLYGVKELYYGILLESKREDAAKYQLEYKKAEYNDAINAQEYGEILAVDVKALRAEISEQEQELLKAQNKKEDYILTFKQMLGLGFNQQPLLVMDAALVPLPVNRQDYTTEALQDNPSLEIAGLTVQKADLGVDAAKKEYIPGLTLFMQYNNNKGIPLTPRSYFLAGLNLEWDIISSGERSAVVRQRKALWNEASEDLAYKKESIKNEIEKIFLNLQYAVRLKETANEALEARAEELRLAGNAVEEGEALNTKLLEAKADFAQAEADVLG